MTDASRPLRVGAALAAVVTFGRGATTALDVPSWVERHGLSNFGRPPELGLLSAALALGAALWLLWPAARPRRAVAGLTSLLLLLATALEGRLVPHDDALRLGLAAAALWAAAPWIRIARPSTWVTAVALLLALPAVTTSLYPHGVVLWSVHVVPVAALALCLPASFASARAPVFALLVAAALAGFASAASYPIAAAALDLPVSALASTRLTVLGLHPNLAVPLLAVALTLGVGLVVAGSWRLPALAALAVAAAALVGVASRTGFVVAALGVGLVVAWTLVAQRPGLAKALRVAWFALVVALVVGAAVPATTWTTDTITTRSASMVSKAVTFRSAMWELGRDTWAAAPWHGHGPGTLYEQAAVARPGRYDGMPKDDHPHSIVLLVASALGLPGLLALALLFAWTARPPRPGARPDEAALAAAAVAMWAANTIDLGGAINTLYPALAFALLGLRDVTDDDAPAPRPGALGGALLAALAVAGLVLAVQRDARRDLERRFDAVIDPLAEATEVAAITDALDGAAALVPTDPGLPLLRARIAIATGDPDAARDHLDEALRRFPRSAFLQHQRALALSRTATAPDEIEAALDAAIALDPHGPDAWRRWLDRANVAAARGATSVARDALVSAFLANPHAAADVPLVTADGARSFAPGGVDGARVAVDDVLAELDARRDRWREIDPAYATRFDLRGSELLRAIGAFAEADARAATIGAGPDASYYATLMRARDAFATERFDEAAALFAQTNDEYRAASTPAALAVRPLLTIPLVEELDARSRSAELDADLFAERSDLLLATLGDLRFETNDYRLWTDARRRVAERSGDAEAAARLAEALAYLER